MIFIQSIIISLSAISLSNSIIHHLLMIKLKVMENEKEKAIFNSMGHEKCHADSKESQNYSRKFQIWIEKLQIYLMRNRKNSNNSQIHFVEFE